MNKDRTPRPLTRRALLAGAGAAGLAAGLPWHIAAAADLSVGFLYIGSKDDFGFNQSHAVGAAALREIAGVTVLEEENVPESIAAQRSMESMIRLDGAGLIFPTSFGHFDPHMLTMAARFPDVTFRHAGGLWQEGVHPQNAGSYFAFIDEAVYLSGVVAGHASASGRLGFIAAKPLPFVARNINAFALGARSVNPDATVQLIITGDWVLPTREAAAVNVLADQGIDVVSCHVDSPKIVIEAAEARGLMTCGYHADQGSLAPRGYLTGAEWNWGTFYKDFARTMLAGGTPPNFLRGGIAEGFVRSSPYGSAVSDGARRNAEAVRTQMLNGDFVIFGGPLKDNRGNIVVDSATQHAQNDIVLERMDYLVEGIIGSLG